MRGYRFLWPVGLALSLNGCAGTAQNLTARPSDAARPSLRMLAGGDRPATSNRPSPAAAGDAETVASVTPAGESSGQRTAAAPTPDQGDPFINSGGLFSRVGRVFSPARWTGTSQAKAGSGRIAGNDPWADWAKMNLQAKAQAARNRENPAEAQAAPSVAQSRRPVTDAENSVLPVALQVGSNPSEPQGRPRMESPVATPRPRADGETPEALTPETLPDAVEPDEGDGIRRTSAEDVLPALSDQPPAPDRPTPAPAPAPAPAQVPDTAPPPRAAPAPRPKPSTAPAEEPGPTTAPATEPKPAPEPTQPATANPAAAPEPNPAPESAPAPSPPVEEPSAQTPTPSVPTPDATPSPQAAPVAPSKAKPAAVAPMAAPAPAAPSKAKPPAVAPSAQKATPAPAPKTAPAVPAAAKTPVPPSKTLPAAVAPSPQVQTAVKKKHSLLDRFHQWKHSKTKPTTFAAPAAPTASSQTAAIPPGAAPTPASPQAQAQGQAQANTTSFTDPGGYVVSAPLFPMSYYQNPGADTAYRYRPPAAPAGTTDASVNTASTATTVKPAPAGPAAPATPPGQWSAVAPKASAAKGPRISLFSRFTSWARGDEIEVDRHALNCDCGDHPRGKGVSTPTPTAVPIRPLGSIVPSVGAETGDLSKVREGVKRLASDGLDKASQR